MGEKASQYVVRYSNSIYIQATGSPLIWIDVLFSASESHGHFYTVGRTACCTDTLDPGPSISAFDTGKGLDKADGGVRGFGEGELFYPHG